LAAVVVDSDIAIHAQILLLGRKILPLIGHVGGVYEAWGHPAGVLLAVLRGLLHLIHRFLLTVQVQDKDLVDRSFLVCRLLICLGVGFQQLLATFALQHLLHTLSHHLFQFLLIFLDIIAIVEALLEGVHWLAVLGLSDIVLLLPYLGQAPRGYVLHQQLVQVGRIRPEMDNFIFVVDGDGFRVIAPGLLIGIAVRYRPLKLVLL